ncbi:MAG: histidine phosphatase family protein [Nitrosopumilus sp.]|nr:histidine phosphatase family protein [Nitrosopumilus sp.]MDA7943077.1 histidine phosphatase family protein [Nitrosopumilus sp.]MDA7958736.1 histidine phosphatase family protein [Nitrosopumilus sp.]MDA7959874.1 histidine phosphatase family protein [Nitrosopumilus sp.]
MPILTGSVRIILLFICVRRIRTTNLIFARHGQARNNVDRVLAGRAPGFPLTDEGRRQAAGAARLLAGMGISAIYCSPIQRARETAGIMAGGSDITVDGRLSELEMGSFTGKTYEEISGTHGNVFLRFYEGDPGVGESGVETFESVRRRVAEIAREAASRHPGGNVLLVTHMDPIKAMIFESLHPPPEALFGLVIENASLNIFRYGEAVELGAINVMEPGRLAPLNP